MKHPFLSKVELWGSSLHPANTLTNTLTEFSGVLTNSSLTQAGRNDDSGELMILEAQRLLPLTWYQYSASDWISPNFCSYFQSRAEYIISDTCGPFSCIGQCGCHGPMINSILTFKLFVVLHICHSSTQEAGADTHCKSESVRGIRSLWQPGTHGETLSWKIQRNESK